MEKMINKFLAVSLILAALFGGIAFLTRNYPHASEAGGTFTFPLLEYLDIDLQRLDVSFIPYDGEEITVEYKNDRPLDMEVGDNKLTITESAAFVVSLFAGKRSEFGVKLYLPKTLYRDVSVYTGTGSVDIGDGFDCQKLTVVTESGNVAVRNMGFLSSISTTDGDIYANIGFIVSGTSFLDRNGNAEIILPQDSSVTVDFKTKDGEFKSELLSGQVPGDYKYSFNGGKNQISATAEHGTLTLKERRKTA